MTKFVMYSTEGCHLCDDAWSIVVALGEEQRITIQDIIEDPRLVDFYGDKIPVIHNLETNQAVFWPFNQHQLQEFLSI